MTPPNTVSWGQEDENRPGGFSLLPGTVCLSAQVTVRPEPSPGKVLWGGDRGGDLSPAPPAQQSPAGSGSASLGLVNLASPGTAASMGTVTGPPQDPDPGGHYQFRVIVLGDTAVGKSSLLRCFAEGPGGGGVGVATPCPTVGVEFYSRTILLPPAGKAKLQLWDTAGQERFR